VTDAEYEAAKGRIKAAAERWLQPMGLLWWQIDLVWSRENIPSQNDHTSTGACGASTRVWWPYLTAEVTFNLPALADRDDEFLDQVVVHEFAHILLDELARCGEDDRWQHVERVTTLVTKALVWVRQAGAKDAA
jgi:hypothetical protein